MLTELFEIIADAIAEVKKKKKRGGDTGKRADWPETENSISASMGKCKAPEWCCRGLTEGFSCILVSHPLPLTALFFAFLLFFSICFIQFVFVDL